MEVVPTVLHLGDVEVVPTVLNLDDVKVGYPRALLHFYAVITLSGDGRRIGDPDRAPVTRHRLKELP